MIRPVQVGLFGDCYQVVSNFLHQVLGWSIPPVNYHLLGANFWIVRSNFQIETISVTSRLHLWHVNLQYRELEKIIRQIHEVPLLIIFSQRIPGMTSSFSDAIIKFLDQLITSSRSRRRHDPREQPSRSTILMVEVDSEGEPYHHSGQCDCRDVELSPRENFQGSAMLLEWLNAHDELFRVDVLQVTHDSSTEPFLGRIMEILQPFMVTSCREYMSRHHRRRLMERDGMTVTWSIRTQHQEVRRRFTMLIPPPPETQWWVPFHWQRARARQWERELRRKFRLIPIISSRAIPRCALHNARFDAVDLNSSETTVYQCQTCKALFCPDCHQLIMEHSLDWCPNINYPRKHVFLPRLVPLRSTTELQLSSC